MATVRLSKKFSLDVPDFIRGAVLAGLVSALTIVEQSVEKGSLDFNFKAIGSAFLLTFISYLIKNFFLEAPKVITTVDTNTKAVNATEKIKDAV